MIIIDCTRIRLWLIYTTVMTLDGCQMFIEKATGLIVTWLELRGPGKSTALLSAFRNGLSAPPMLH
jgi:hypothetical protein